MAVGAESAAGAGRLHALVAGLVVATLGLASLGVLSVQPTLDIHVGVGESIYSWYHWALGLAAVMAGLAIVVGSRPVRRGGAVVGAVASAQLAGVGLVAHEKWFAYFGGMGGPVQNHADLEKFALAMTACCAAAALVCLEQLRADRAFSLHASPGGMRALSLVAGVAVAILVPYLLTRNDNGTEAKTLLALAAVYGIPWGVAIALSAWLRPPAATIAVLAVAGSASFAAFCDAQWTYDFEDLVIGADLGPAFGLAATVAVLVVLVRLGVDHRPTARSAG